MAVRRVLTPQMSVDECPRALDRLVLRVHPRLRMGVDANNMAARSAEDKGPVRVLGDVEEVDIS